MAAGDELQIPESGAVFTFGRSRFSDNQPSHFFIRNDPVIHISCGDEHTILICQKGRVFAFGSNDSGQLGLGHTRAADKPTCVKAAKPWAACLAACGKSHSLLATRCGRVFSFGSNADGQLGLGDRQDRLMPTPIALELPEESGVLALSAGCLHSALLTAGGDLLTWGGNADGQCGTGAAGDSILIPTKITLNSPATSIACGYYHTAICADGLWTMGEGDSGKLGVVGEGENHVTPQRVDLPESAVPCLVAAGGNHTLVLTVSGEVYGFGSNFSGQLGADVAPAVQQPTLVSFGKRVVRVACGESHSAFLTEDGELYTCGDARHGKLCQESLGDNSSQPGLVKAMLLHQVLDVACGGCHTMVLAKPRSDLPTLTDPDVEVVISGKALPPLKTRKLASDVPIHEDSITNIMLDESPETPTEITDVDLTNDGGIEAEEVDGIVTAARSEVGTEDGDGDSLTESCGGAGNSTRMASPTSRGREKSQTTISPLDTIVPEDQSKPPKPTSRIHKLVSALRRRKASNGVRHEECEIVKADEKPGNQGASKACIIL